MLTTEIRKCHDYSIKYITESGVSHILFVYGFCSILTKKEIKNGKIRRIFKSSGY